MKNCRSYCKKYSEEWRLEAEKRGLLNLNNTISALQVLLTEDNAKLFEKYKVLSKQELHSRYDVFLEEYQRKIIIEGKTALEMVNNIIMPVVRDELKANIDTVLKWQDLKLESEVTLFKNHIELLASKFNLMILAMKKLAESLNEENYEE